MPEPEPTRRLTREEGKAQTRAELLRAADRLFLRNGFVATSLADIAEEAALTKGAVYSNFASKEDLFLALLQELADPESTWLTEESVAPSDPASAKGDTPEERMRDWGRSIAERRPSRRHVSLFLEMNAAALRNEEARTWVAAHNETFFRRIGVDLAEVLDAPGADPLLLGLFAESIYVGLLMHGGFDDSPAAESTYVSAYSALAVIAVELSAQPA